MLIRAQQRKGMRELGFEPATQTSLECQDLPIGQVWFKIKVLIAAADFDMRFGCVWQQACTVTLKRMRFGSVV